MPKNITKKMIDRFIRIDEFIKTNKRMITNKEISILFNVSIGQTTKNIINQYLKSKKQCILCKQTIKNTR